MEKLYTVHEAINGYIVDPKEPRKNISWTRRVSDFIWTTNHYDTALLLASYLNTFLEYTAEVRSCDHDNGENLRNFMSA